MPVAVKVQYPGVDEAITADLNNDNLFDVVPQAGIGLARHPDDMVAEIKERLVEELDYRLEGRNQAEGSPTTVTSDRIPCARSP